MNPIQRISVSFCVTLLLGGLMFAYQTQQLDEFERRAESRPGAAGTAVPQHEEIPGGNTPDAAPAATSPQSAKEWTTAFTAKLKEALVTALTEEHMIMILNSGPKGMAFESLTAAVSLTHEESDTIRQGLEQYDKRRAALYLNHNLAPAALASGLAEAKRHHEQWLVAQLGNERYESVLHSDEWQTRASAERTATESVSRINSAADLSQTQRDKLYSGFLELNLHPPKVAEDKLVVETYGRLEFGPSAPDLSEDVEEILTPEQLRIYQLKRQATAQSTVIRTELMMEAVEVLKSAAIGLGETDH